MNHQSRFDWDRLREVPLVELLRDAGLTEKQLRGSEHFDCPEHPGHCHASFWRKGNRVTCWLGVTGGRKKGGAGGKTLDAVDWYAAHYKLSKAAAAEELSRRFGIPMREPSEPPPAPRPVAGHQLQWRRMVAGGLTGAGLEFLASRGLPREYVANLAQRGLVATEREYPVHLSGDEQRSYSETVSFPAWSPDDASTWLDPQLPTTIWHRFLQPGRRLKGRKSVIDKDRNHPGCPAAGTVFTTCSADELREAKVVFICEGIIKGLAVDAAMCGADLEADLAAARVREAAPDLSADERAGAAADAVRIEGEIASLERLFYRRAWLSVLGVGQGAHVPAILETLFSDRRRRPSIRIAFDHDEAGDECAVKLYRQLTRLKYDALIVRPSREAKDWDGMLAKKSGGDAVRKALRTEDTAPIYRPGGYAIAPQKFSHQHGWQLRADWTERDKQGNSVEKFDIVADFVLRGVYRYVTYGWDAAKPDRTVLSVIACTRAESNGTYGLRESWIADEDFNHAQRWSAIGTVHTPKLLLRYISDAKDMIDETSRIVPVVGLCRDPEKPGRFILVDGSIRQRINETYRGTRIASPYDHVDWSAGKFAGARDGEAARRDGRRLFEALAAMFPSRIAAVVGYWTAGNLLKVAAKGNWPHVVAIGQKGSGKSTLVRVLQAAFSVHSSALSDWDTSFRALGTMANHCLPVILDECSRVSERRLQEVQGLFNQCFDAGQQSVRYGPDSYPLCLAGSFYMTGQDTISDNASKQLSLSLTQADALAGREPNLAELPHWPWGAWGRWLLDELRPAQASEDLDRWSDFVGDFVPVLAADRARLVGCWARLCWAREMVRRFLGYDVDPVPSTATDPELLAIVELIREAAGSGSDTGEALDMLRAYSAVVMNEAGAHPVTVERGGPDHDGAWIVPEAILDALRRRGLRFALRDARRFNAALQAEGLLGSPQPTDPEAEWIGGSWKDGKPRRCQVVHIINGKSQRIPSYLVPRRVLELRALHFPESPNTTDGKGG